MSNGTLRNYVSSLRQANVTNASMMHRIWPQFHCSLNRAVVMNLNRKMSDLAIHQFDCVAMRVGLKMESFQKHPFECL